MGDYADMAWDPCDAGSWMDLPRPDHRPRQKTCNRCGKGGLFWGETDRGWRLHEYVEEDGDLERLEHRCGSAPEEGSQARSASDGEVRETGEARPERPDPQLHKGERR